MANLVYRSKELYDLTVVLDFVIVEGWYDGKRVRRPETTVPGKAGQIVETAVDDLRVVRLHGVLAAPSAATWNTQRAALETAFDPQAVAASLVVTSPFMGLAAGTRTISAIVESVRSVDLVENLVTEYDVVLNALGDPPDWS